MRSLRRVRTTSLRRIHILFFSVMMFSSVPLDRLAEPFNYPDLRPRAFRSHLERNPGIVAKRKYNPYQRDGSAA